MRLVFFIQGLKITGPVGARNAAIDLGRRLDVNYVIAGNIQKKDKNEFSINGRLFSVDMETMVNEFAMNSSGITDSLLLEMKKMAYNAKRTPSTRHLVCWIRYIWSCCD